MAEPDKKTLLTEKLRNSREEARDLLAQMHEHDWERLVNEAWTIKDTISHLAANDLRLAELSQRVLAGKPLYEAGYNHNEFNNKQVEQRRGLSVREVLAEFETNRAQLLALIEGLSEEQLSASAYHPSFGEVSVAMILERAPNHEQSHLKQIRQAIASFGDVDKP